MELHLDIKTGDLHIGDRYVIRHGMTRKELLAQEGIEKLFYDDAVYNRVNAMMHTFEDRGHSVFMRVGFEFKEEHPENAKITDIIMKLDDATARIYRGVGILEYMDIEDGYVDYVRKITGVMNYYLGKGIFFEDNKGHVSIMKSLQAPNLCIFYKYPEG